MVYIIYNKYTYIGWITVNGFTPQRFRVIANAETAHAWSGHIQQPMSHCVALEIGAFLFQAGCKNNFKSLLDVFMAIAHDYCSRKYDLDGI